MKITANKVILGSFAVLIIIAVGKICCKAWPTEFVLVSKIIETLSDFETYFYVLFVAGWIAKLFEPTYSKIIPTLEEGFGKIANTVGTQFQAEAAKTREVFLKVRESPPLEEPIVPEEDREEPEKLLASMINEVRSFYQQGKIKETVEGLKEIESSIDENIDRITDLTLFEETIDLELTVSRGMKKKRAILLLDLYKQNHGISNDLLRLAMRVAVRLDDEDIALVICSELKRQNPDDPFAYVEIGVMYHSLGKIKEAIEETEEALKKSEKSNLEDHIVLSKANLAYYYADTGLTTVKDKAIEYANLAMEANPGMVAYKDTLGFVKIVFGESKEDIEEGMSLCEEVRKAGGPLEYYQKHLEIAIQRLKEF